jgi:TPP-dependent pyruvate/acetoin dehydrogenase alpha subunit
VFAVWRTVKEAIERARRGEGATLIEALTYRVGAHSTSDDPRGYRKDDEVEPWKSKDPLPRLRQVLESRGLWSAAEETKAIESMEVAIKTAVETAEKKGPPSLESLFDEVYAKRPWHLEEQYELAKYYRSK